MITEHDNEDKKLHALFNDLSERITQNFPADTAKLIIQFMNRLYANVDYEDLCEKSLDNLYGSLLSMWNLIYQRRPSETKVRIYNPTLEEDAWESPHTIIEISHDDMPFLVDSMQMDVTRHNIDIHLILYTGGMQVQRDGQNKLTAILSKDSAHATQQTEAPIYLEIERETDPAVLDTLRVSIEKTLDDVTAVVADYPAMTQKTKEAMDELENAVPFADPREVTESRDFLRWLLDRSFIFIGYYEVNFIEKNNQRFLQYVPNSGLGILKDKFDDKRLKPFEDLPEAAQELAMSSQIIIFNKTKSLSTVNRDAYTDCVMIKRFNAEGRPIGERRLIGLYTLDVYASNPTHIPLLRYKIQLVLELADLNPLSYAGRRLKHILENLPREELFQASVKQLLLLSRGILQLQDRQRVRIFIREDICEQYYSCLLFVPRENINTYSRHRMQTFLKEAFNAISIVSHVTFLDSPLARIHYVLRIDPKHKPELSHKALEQKLTEILRSWNDRLKEKLIQIYGGAKGLYYFNRYENAFSTAYQESFKPRSAVYDIEQIEQLTNDNVLSVSFYQEMNDPESNLHLKLFQKHSKIPLSDALPILENMNLRFIDERPYEIVSKTGEAVWVNDFEVEYSGEQKLVAEEVRENFQEAFLAVWAQKAENDLFNSLILSAKLNWREVSILRAYAKYFRQIGLSFSQNYIEETLKNNAHIARYLIDLFHVRFNPSRERDATLKQFIISKIDEALDSIPSLDQDRIIRNYLEAIFATVRTNFFVCNEEGTFRDYISFKIESHKIADLPLPKPLFEIFTYSPRFEGIHLRAAKVARGGLRWSDRREDFRTEILGLMKAQQVKNAVIVPLGAKGGFVLKSNLLNASRDEIQAEGVACYESFISSLLDVTDNLKQQNVIHPENVVRHDEDDPYLVVAADKGTATFSDIANGIAEKYEFWLGDAFASGGKTGYDHKKMGITARGAWESVKRHFREMGINTQKESFTMVGIGDMSGDVFGNGALLSRHIKLIAAFDHRHIFIDPNPDEEISFAERTRLFHLPRSSWEDYDQNKISLGGAVFKRTAKTLKLTPQIKALFGIENDHILPNELIRLILKADVDLLFNGGIGTFVKASTETNAEAGDRTNDVLRINANELRCKVVGEGGNLGLTQRGRIEYALNGGRIYTDFIDNSGGVDCSDHEVNIKVLLNGVVASNELSEKKRNQLLEKMTKDVAQLVLMDNYRQTGAISLAALNATKNLDLYARYMRQWEQAGKINRAIEFLPNEEDMIQRKAKGHGLTNPELSILFEYAKIILKEDILASDLPEDPYFLALLREEFPKTLRDKYQSNMQQHPLRREIIATQICNLIIDRMGITFINRLQEESGASVVAIVKAFMIARTLFKSDKLWAEIEALDLKVSADVQFEMFKYVNRLVRRATRWFLTNRLESLDIQATIDQFERPVAMLTRRLMSYITETDKQLLNEKMTHFKTQKVPEELAQKIASCLILLPALDIVEATIESGHSIRLLAKAYFILGELLDINWFREQILMYQVESQWDALARVAFRDDTDRQQRELTMMALKASRQRHQSMQERMQSWIDKNNTFVDRWKYMISNIKAVPSIESIMFSVGLRELYNLVQACK